MELFNQFSGLMSPMADWLEPDITIVNSEASLQGKSATYQITILKSNNNSTDRHMG